MVDNSLDQHGLSAKQTTVGTLTRSVRLTLVRVRRNMATQDWLCMAFHAYLSARILLAPDSAAVSGDRLVALGLLGVTAAMLFAVRGELLKPGVARSLLYRVGIFLPLLGSYLLFRTLLPALAPTLLDAELLAVDEFLIGVTPAVWLERFNTRPVVEWFSFFYYSYFPILLVMVAPTLLADRGRRQIELVLGTIIVVTVGHLGYTLVPGVGPFDTDAVHFEGPLDGGFWWGLVWSAVQTSGALLDIFPSLHTALPTFFALHAIGHRRRLPFKYAWPVLVFFAANIIVATLLLRWHYGIDVVFGLMLALSARGASVWVSKREIARGGDGDGRQPVWEPLMAASQTTATKESP